jgi:hypothetical protein
MDVKWCLHCKLCHSSTFNFCCVWIEHKMVCWVVQRPFQLGLLVSQTTASNDRMIDEQWIGRDAEGRDGPKFAWRNWWKQRKISVSVTGLHIDIWTRSTRANHWSATLGNNVSKLSALNSCKHGGQAVWSRVRGIVDPSVSENKPSLVHFFRNMQGIVCQVSFITNIRPRNNLSRQSYGSSLKPSLMSVEQLRGDAFHRYLYDHLLQRTLISWSLSSFDSRADSCGRNMHWHFVTYSQWARDVNWISGSNHQEYLHLGRDGFII